MSDGALTAGRSAKRQPLLRLLSDERLVKLACEGSTQAFATIYERHHQAVYRYSRSILRSDHDARDALQSTMLKAMQALSGEKREIALRPWLFRIAHNESISLLRSQPTDVPIDRASEIAAVEAHPEARDRLRALIADLDQLSLRQRSALVMRELNGLEFEEIGLALEASPEAAKQAVYEARLALHELEEGREMTCEEVCRKISAEDRRVLRARRVRGHLRSCESCRVFSRSTRTRRSQLACVAPPLPAPIALGILDGLIGGGSGGGGIATLAGGGGAAGLGGSVAAKLGVAGILALGIGTAALENGEPRAVAAGANPGAEAARPGPTGPAVDSAGDADRARHSDEETQRAQGDGRGNGHDDAGTTGPTALGDGATGRQNADPSSSAAAHTVPDKVGPPSSGPAGPPADSAGGGEDASPTGSDESPLPPAEDNGRGPTGVPPGQGGVPPGQGGDPPGLGAPPPGLTDTPPGQGGLPPGHGGEPPGRGP